MNPLAFFLAAFTGAISYQFFDDLTGGSKNRAKKLAKTVPTSADSEPSKGGATIDGESETVDNGPGDIPGGGDHSGVAATED